MYTSNFTETSNSKKLKTVLESFKKHSNYDISFLFDQSYHQLENLYGALCEFHNKKLYESHTRDQSYYTNFLLTEAVRLILSEYTAGTKRKRRKKNKTNESDNYTVYSQDGVPIHTQADLDAAEDTARIWQDENKGRMEKPLIVKGPIQTHPTDWKNPVEEYERDSPIEDEIETEDGLPTASAISRLEYSKNNVNTQASPGSEHESLSYVERVHPDQEEIEGKSMNEQKLRKLKEKRNRLKKQMDLLKESRNTYRQSRKKDSMAHLIEGHIEQAEVILSARDTVNKLQDMSEDIAKMQVEDLLPLVDSIKGTFSYDSAEMFEKAVNDDLQKALDTVREARESVNNAVLRLEGKLSDEDMPQTDMGSDEGDDEEEPKSEIDLDSDEGEGDEDSDLELDLGDDDEGDEEESEPLGRKMKESRSRRKTKISESDIKKGDRVKITGGDHKNKTGKMKVKDVRGPNSLVTINGNDEYVSTKYIKKATNEGRRIKKK